MHICIYIRWWEKYNKGVESWMGSISGRVGREDCSEDQQCWPEVWMQQESCWVRYPGKSLAVKGTPSTERLRPKGNMSPLYPSHWHSFLRAGILSVSFIAVPTVSRTCLGSQIFASWMREWASVRLAVRAGPCFSLQPFPRASCGGQGSDPKEQSGAAPGRGTCWGQDRLP